MENSAAIEQLLTKLINHCDKLILETPYQIGNVDRRIFYAVMGAMFAEVREGIRKEEIKEVVEAVKEVETEIQGLLNEIRE